MQPLTIKLVDKHLLFELIKSRTAEYFAVNPVNKYSKLIEMCVEGNICDEYLDIITEIVKVTTGEDLRLSERVRNTISAPIGVMHVNEGELYLTIQSKSVKMCGSARFNMDLSESIPATDEEIERFLEDIDQEILYALTLELEQKIRMIEEDDE